MYKLIHFCYKTIIVNIVSKNQLVIKLISGFELLSYRVKIIDHVSIV